jgi:hypothetical protein
MELHEWIDSELKKPGKRASGLAKKLGVTADKISKMRKGTRQPQARELPIIEAYFGQRAPVVLASDVDDESPPAQRTVRLIGYVGAGAQAFFLEGELDEVPAPEGTTPNTVAVEIRGSSLGALFDRWLVFYDDIRSPVTPDLYGRVCIVGLADERVLIKKIQHTTSGLFNLLSNTEDPIKSVTIEWAARVKHMVPR